MSPLRDRLERSRLYFVGDERAVERALPAALRGGADLFQLRMKDAGDDAVLRAAERARVLCTEHGALFLVNDRPDLALAAGADGVHVGQDDTPVAEARAAVGDERIVGLSTHAPAQLAAAAGVDYVAGRPGFVGVAWTGPTAT